MRSRIGGTGSAVTHALAAALPPTEVRARLVDVALTASVHALAAAGRRPRDVECVTVATDGSAAVVGLASALGAGLGLVGVPAFSAGDETNAFLYALSAADHFVRLGTYRTVLVATVDAGRPAHGQAAAAAATVLVAETAAARGVLAMGLRSDGRFTRAATDGAGSGASCYASEASEEALRVTGLGAADVDLMIAAEPHETASQLPRRLDDAVRAQRVAAGDVVLLVTSGAGLTWGWAVLRW